MDTQLLANIEFHLRGANWQRGGGKSGSKPKPLELPGSKQSKARKVDGAEVAQRLRNMGLIPA